MNIDEVQVVKICNKANLEYEGFEILGRGAFNINYLIFTKQGKYVLRIENNREFKNLKNEYKILKDLDGRFGPKAYFFDDSKEIISRDFLIEEFIEEGEHPSREATYEFIQYMGKWYKNLHKIRTQAKPDFLDKSPYYSLKKAFDHYCGSFYANAKYLDGELYDKLRILYEKALKVIEKNDKLFEKRTYFSLNQGDPTRYNIFYSKNSVRLVDWEFAKYELREWDLAFFVWSFDLEKKGKRDFLFHAGYPISQTSAKQFEIIYLMHCLSLSSWIVGRLRLVSEGKIDNNQKMSSKEKILEGFKEDIEKIEDALKYFE